MTAECPNCHCRVIDGLPRHDTITVGMRIEVATGNGTTITGVVTHASPASMWTAIEIGAISWVYLRTDGGTPTDNDIVTWREVGK